MTKIICSKCGNEITQADLDSGNWREDNIWDGDGNVTQRTAHLWKKCPTDKPRQQAEIDWDKPLAQANPASWIVK